MDHALTVFPLLDVRAFDVPRFVPSDEPLLSLQGPDTSARGRDEPSGFLVLEGATGRAEAVPSIHSWLRERRNQLIDQGLLVQENGRLRLTANHRFDSPSAAAGVLLGRAANGRVEWKDDSGRTLKELQTSSP